MLLLFTAYTLNYLKVDFDYIRYFKLSFENLKNFPIYPTLITN